MAYIKLFYSLDIYKAASQYSKVHDWFVSVNMQTGRYSSPYSHALDAYWPGLLVRDHMICYCMMFMFKHRLW